MPTATSPAARPTDGASRNAPAGGPGGRPVGERATGIRFRRAVTLMLMTLLVPGSAQLVAGNRRVGRLALRIWLSLIVLVFCVFALALLSRTFAFWMFANTSVLAVLRFALMLLAVGWATLFVDAWRLGQPLSLGPRQRLAAVGLNGLLCFSVAGSMLFGAHLVGVQREFIATTFGSSEVKGAHEGRFNVLLLGGDAGVGRTGLRPDSITLASIDAETGRTVLIGLPRNMAKVPFAEGSVMDKQFPRGFNCDDCYLNAASTWAMDHRSLFKKSKNPGVDATVAAVEGVTGLEVNYWAMVNLRGFANLVDAMGGVTLRVRSPIPVGGLGSNVTGYIKPGKRKLNGRDTLWFARAREGSDDYSRMARQKCVMNAIVTQISPQVAVRNFQDLAKASSDMIATNLPAKELDTFIGLALKAKSQPISTLSLVPPLINTADPDFSLVQTRVRESIERAEGTASAAPANQKKLKRKQRNAPVTGGSVGSLSTGYAANQADDLGASC
jgi:LCP family protein required for cell wall assembly